MYQFWLRMSCSLTPLTFPVFNHDVHQTITKGTEVHAAWTSPWKRHALVVEGASRESKLNVL